MQIKNDGDDDDDDDDDVWAPYASMKSHICFDRDNGPVAVVDIDIDNDRRGRVDRGSQAWRAASKSPLCAFFF